MLYPADTVETVRQAGAQLEQDRREVAARAAAVAQEAIEARRAANLERERAQAEKERNQPEWHAKVALSHQQPSGSLYTRR